MGFNKTQTIFLSNLKPGIWWKERIFVKQWPWSSSISRLKIRNKQLLGNLHVITSLLNKSGSTLSKHSMLIIVRKKLIFKSFLIISIRRKMSKYLSLSEVVWWFHGVKIKSRKVVQMRAWRKLDQARWAWTVLPAQAMAKNLEIAIIQRRTSQSKWIK